MNHNATNSMSRRNVLKATGGLLAGATLFAGSGAAEGEAEPEPQFEIVDVNEEVIVAKVTVLEEFSPDPANMTWTGLADDFIVREDAVSLPEGLERLAQPVEMEPGDTRTLNEETYRMYFRTGDIAWDDGDGDFWEGEEVTLGLGVFPERTVSRHYWDTDTVPGWRSDE